MCVNPHGTISTIINLSLLGLFTVSLTGLIISILKNRKSRKKWLTLFCTSVVLYLLIIFAELIFGWNALCYNNYDPLFMTI